MPGAATYELGALTAMPGLIDVHAHIGWHFDKDGRFASRPGTPAQEILYSAENAYVTLMAGFTTIQSPGQPSDADLREAIARGVLPGPRILTSIRTIDEHTGAPRGGNRLATPDELREFVRRLKADGADVAEDLRISQHPRWRQADDDRRADPCGVRRGEGAGLRSMVHAHSSASVRAAVNAGCDQIEHGVLIDQETLTLMAQKGVYFDPNVGVVLQNYLRNKDRYLGIGNYNEAGFAAMEKGLAINAEMIRKAVATPNLKLVLGTDAVAGAHGHNADEIVERVRAVGNQKPADAIISATSLSALAALAG